MRTGQGMTWNAQRVCSVRREHGIHAYRSAEKNGEWLTMSEAAKLAGVTHYFIRRLINERICMPTKSYPMHHTKSGPAISKVRQLLPPLHVNDARVG